MAEQPKIAVIGAGMAGLRLAQRLAHAADVEIFEKSRGFSGRMSTRRAPSHQFDHGAQYFTARSKRFQSFLKPFKDKGVVAQWTPQVVSVDGKQSKTVVWTSPRYVAVPGMNALCKSMAEDVTVTRGQRVLALTRSGSCWTVAFEDGSERGGFDWVFGTAPSDQSALLLPELTDWTPLRMHGCFSLMVGLDRSTDLPFDAAYVTSGPLAWIAVNSSKPGREGGVSILCQSDNHWADGMMEADLPDVEMELCKALEEITGITAATAPYTSLHRWRYAKARQQSTKTYLLDVKARSGAAGDWCGEGRVESAFDSAEAPAEAVLDHLKLNAA